MDLLFYASVIGTRAEGQQQETRSLQARNGIEDPNQPCCHCDQCDTLLHLVSPVREYKILHMSDVTI